LNLPKFWNAAQMVMAVPSIKDAKMTM